MIRLPPRDTRIEAALGRVWQVMTVLRGHCEWDAAQTHHTLVQYLIEETGEAVEALEVGDAASQCEELGDLLLQVFFHSQIASETGDYTVAEVAEGISAKLIRRHPHVFADAPQPDDKEATWEQAKRREKGRASALDGIAEPLSALARATKVIARTRHHRVPVDLPDAPITAAEVGRQLLQVSACAQAHGIDAEQALREAVRALEQQVRETEASTTSNNPT